jgi:hypothetical protein
MSFNENDYSTQHLLGNANVPRNTNPYLRATLRRSDPDGISAAPYYADASGKTLRVTYTKEVLGVVTDFQEDIALASNSLATIITTINAVDANHLEARDDDGFLVLRNKNPGKTHRIQVDPWTVAVDDAAPIFGFRVTPFPGSVSYAGEISSAPGSRTEQNPQGTALVARDEDISAQTWNRSSAHLLQLMQEILSDLERDVVVYREVDATFEVHPISNTISSIELTDDTLRLPIEVMGMAGETSGDLTGKLNAFFTILSDDGSNEETGVDPDADTLNDLYDRASITNALYATDATAFDDGQSFADWGTPDGASIYGPTVPNKDKHPVIAIESFDGNIAYCPGATFETLLVKKNDPVEITDPIVTTPFDHSGWFAVESVIDEEHVALRPMSPSERDPGSGNRPRAINRAGLGDLRVAVGYFIPASSVWLTSDIEGTPTVKLRIAVGIPLREALAEDFALGRTGTWNHLAALLDDHINGATGPTGRHEASQINGFTTTGWRDSSTSTGDNLLSLINDIVNDLQANGGSLRLGATAINIGGATPNTIAAGSINDQFVALLTELRDQVNYDGSGNWNDGTSIPAQNIETAIDQVVSDLAAETAADDGSMKIGAEAHGDLDAGSVADQLTQLQTEWGKLDRPQTWTALNGFTHIINAEGPQTGDTNEQPVLLTGTQPTGGSAKLLWEIQVDALAFVRIYMYKGALVDIGVSALAITINAEYETTGDEWAADNPGDRASIFVLTSNSILFAGKSATGTAWADATDWDTPLILTNSGELFSPTGAEITGSGGFTADVNDDMTVSGTGRHRHGARELNIGAAAWVIETGSGTATLTGGRWTTSSIVAFQAPVLLEAGKTISNVTFEFDRAGAGDITFTLVKRTGATVTVIETLVVAAGTGLTTGSFASPPNYTVEAGHEIYLRAVCTAAANQIIQRAAVDYFD